MAAPRLRVYIAASLDGYIATTDGGVDWLAPYTTEDYGYEAFLAEVGAIIMGRATFDQVHGFGPWPYPGRRTIVLTSRPMEAPAEGAEPAAGPPSEVLAALTPTVAGDIWLHGGAQTIAGFLDLGAVDRIELFVIPVLLGDGVRLFGRRRSLQGLRLVAAEPAPRGVVRLLYDLA